MKNYTSILLVAGILLLLNILSKQFFLRFDLTEDKQYTLSNATKNILTNLEDNITVTAYFSEDLPPNVARTKSDFKEMLVEYNSLSKGMVDYEFISPNESPEKEQEALQSGIRPIMINIREKDQMKQQKAFMGAVINMGERKDVIPFMQPGTAMEYGLTTSIKKIAVVDKPAVGLIQGHGEPGLQELQQVYEALSILYNVENLNLGQEETIPERFKTIAFVNPADSIPPSHLTKVDDYLKRGGNVFIAYNAVDGDLQTAQGTAHTTGLESWLQSKGVEVENSFIVDASCGSVSVQQRQGFFTMNTPVQFPFLPMINKFADHPITKGLEQIILPFASPVRYIGANPAEFSSFLTTSAKAGVVPAPTMFDVTNKQWSGNDFPMSNITIGGVLTLPEGGKMVVIGDGDFAVSGQQGRGQSQDNISLLVNSIDFMSDDTGLIDLRTKGVATRPIEDLEDGTRSMYKYGNFLLPLFLVMLYGFYRMQKTRGRRMKRMQENYV